MQPKTTSNPEQEILSPEQVKRIGYYAARFLMYSHCLLVGMKAVEKRGENEVNPSIVKAIENSAASILTGVDAFSVVRIARFAAENGDKALASCEAPNETTRLLAVAYAICKNVEQGHIDADSTLAVTALGMVMESDDTNDQSWRIAQKPKSFADVILRKCDMAMLAF